jgi:mRNA guanylyltransferase
MNVDFCASKAFKIDSKELKDKLFIEIGSLIGIKLKDDYFPGAQPVTIEKKDINKLKNGYMVCEKTDGERAVLILINLNNKPMCFLINRNNELYFMDLSFKKELFEGTIMDGELIKTNKDEWNYLIHDCLAYNGSSFMDLPHSLRYGCIIDCIVKRYSHKETDVFFIKTKLFYKFGPGIDKTWEHIKSTTENKIDGLIFTSIYDTIKFGRDYNLLKWKEFHTIDFLVKKVGKKINLYYTKKGTNVIYRSYTIKEASHIISFMKESDLMDGIIIEFKVNCETDCFTPYRLRGDKNKPNGEITVNNTIINIKENIKIEDLI